MVLRITTLQADPARIEELLDLIKTSVVPAAQQQPGFKQFTVAADRATATVKAIALWATDADVTASDTSGYYQEQIGKVRPYLTAPPQRDVYEVTHQT